MDTFRAIVETPIDAGLNSRSLSAGFARVNPNGATAGGLLETATFAFIATADVQSSKLRIKC